MFYKVYNIYLPEEDLVFCEQHQEAYDCALLVLTNMVAEVANFHAVQKKIFGDNYANIYMRGFFYKEPLEQLKLTHLVFVDRIVDYFVHMYSCSFDLDTVFRRLTPSAPDCPYWRNSREKDETILTEYRTAWEEYEKSLQTLRLSYRDILYCLFSLTDGQYLKQQISARLLERLDKI